MIYRWQTPASDSEQGRMVSVDANDAMRKGAIRLAKAKWEGIVSVVATELGIGKADAMSKARTMYPAEFRAYVNA